jgi:hypothetical protein
LKRFAESRQLLVHQWHRHIQRLGNRGGGRGGRLGCSLGCFLSIFSFGAGGRLSQFLKEACFVHGGVLPVDAVQVVRLVDHHRHIGVGGKCFFQVPENNTVFRECKEKEKKKHEYTSPK